MSPLPRRIYGTVNLVFGAALGAVILGVLPERHALIDGLGLSSSLLLVTAGLALLADAPWAARAARAACAVLLAMGAVVLFGIVGSIGFLDGIYGAVGELGVSVLCVLAALAVPYLIVFPLMQLAHLRVTPRATGAVAVAGDTPAPPAAPAPTPPTDAAT